MGVQKALQSHHDPDHDRHHDDEAACPTRQIMDIIGAKWTLAILPLLKAGPMRNSELRRAMEGVSQRVLTQTLRQLERDGLVTRHDNGSFPRHVEYRLTPLGLSLAEAFATLNAWAVQHRGEILSARADRGGVT